jgi:hypothetical protein
VDNLKVQNIVNQKCDKDKNPCSFSFYISDTFQAFEEIIDALGKKGFKIQQFVDDYMAILARTDKDITEVVKIKDNQMEIRALGKTVKNITDNLNKYIMKIPESEKRSK